jgi:hypothetical protein
LVATKIPKTTGIAQRRCDSIDDGVVDLPFRALRHASEPADEKLGDQPPEHEEGKQDKQRIYGLTDIDAADAVLPDVGNKRPEFFQIIGVQSQSPRAGQVSGIAEKPSLFKSTGKMPFTTI